MTVGQVHLKLVVSNSPILRNLALVVHAHCWHQLLSKWCKALYQPPLVPAYHQISMKLLPGNNATCCFFKNPWDLCCLFLKKCMCYGCIFQVTYSHDAILNSVGLLQSKCLAFMPEVSITECWETVLDFFKSKQEANRRRTHRTPALRSIHSTAATLLSQRNIPSYLNITTHCSPLFIFYLPGINKIMTHVDLVLLFL